MYDLHGYIPDLSRGTHGRASAAMVLQAIHPFIAEHICGYRDGKKPRFCTEMSALATFSSLTSVRTTTILESCTTSTTAPWSLSGSTGAQRKTYQMTIPCD